jgi:hypothetical protein
MKEIADIFRRYGHHYLDRFRDSMLPSHRRASADICAWRTEALGGHLAQCDSCGHLRYSYHSCKNRSCPKCHKNDTERWLEKRREELLPVAYFHLVFTLPEELHHFLRTHQKTLYNVLFKAAAFSLMQLAADPRYVGGKIGILSVLHTWTRAMIYHPHLHFLVPAEAFVVMALPGCHPEKPTWFPYGHCLYSFGPNLCIWPKKLCPMRAFHNQSGKPNG